MGWLEVLILSTPKFISTFDLRREEGDEAEALADVGGPVSDHLAALHLAKVGEVNRQLLLVDAGGETPCKYNTYL